MIASPLRLDEYFFTKVHLDACPDGCDKAVPQAPTSQCECLQHKEEPRKWMVSLELQQEKGEGKDCPAYAFHLSLVGLFEVAADYPDVKMDAMVRANAPAILYGAAREMLLNITSRGPFPPVRLPTVTFIDQCGAPSGDAPTGAGVLATKPSRRPSASTASKPKRPRT